MAKTAYLIRHAEKDDQGTLTDLGRKQARTKWGIKSKMMETYNSN